jgi:phospholipid/cholesterol/gamma-HCH transport system permease protein
MIRAMMRKSYTVRALVQLGEVGELFWKTLRNLLKRPREHQTLLQQLEEIGVRSMPVVSLTAAFGGLVFGFQTYIGFHRYIGAGSEAYGGPIITLGLCKELIPILVGLMISGRVGSSMAAEIGTMKITEQIDALYSLRALAAFFMMPCLTLYGDIIGIAAGYFYTVVLMGVNRFVYVSYTTQYLELWDVMTGLIKAAVFGVVIAIVGCWQGMETEGGAEGVGRATTRTVVLSSITILILNFFISKVLPATLSQ